MSPAKSEWREYDRAIPLAIGGESPQEARSCGGKPYVRADDDLAREGPKAGDHRPLWVRLVPS